MKAAVVLMLSVICVLTLNFSTPSDIYIGKSGWVKFVSEAPLERIEAENSKVSAVINVTQKSVAFKVPIVSFQGFNSALQHEHFNENYMEVDDFPQATFNGKIIEDVDLTKVGTYKVRVKGMLSIHGIEKERIINGKVVVANDGITVASSFEVPLADHDIAIPKIVNQKISEVINVEIKSTLKAQ
ncbi:MAG: YceI family protein [Flavobacteriales bacterium]